MHGVLTCEQTEDDMMGRAISGCTGWAEEGKGVFWGVPSAGGGYKNAKALYNSSHIRDKAVDGPKRRWASCRRPHCLCLENKGLYGAHLRALYSRVSVLSSRPPAARCSQVHSPSVPIPAARRPQGAHH